MAPCKCADVGRQRMTGASDDGLKSSTEKSSAERSGCDGDCEAKGARTTKQSDQRN